MKTDYTLFTIEDDSHGSIFLLTLDTGALKSRIMVLADSLKAAQSVDDGVRYVTAQVDRDAFRIMYTEDLHLQEDDSEQLYHNDCVSIDYGLDSRRQDIQIINICVSATWVFFKISYRDRNDVSRKVETRTIDRKFLI